MSPLLSSTNPGKAPLRSSFSTSMNSSDSWMKPPPDESLPYTIRLTLLHTAVHNIPELRMVEIMEEFISLSSSSPGPTMGYDNYLTLLQNACIRYDSTHTSKPSPASRAAYQHELSPDQHVNPPPRPTPPPPDYSSSGTTYGGIDMPAEEFYQVHTTNLNRPPSVSTITPRMPLYSPPPGRPSPQNVPWPHLPSCQHLQNIE